MVDVTVSSGSVTVLIRAFACILGLSFAPSWAETEPGRAVRDLHYGEVLYYYYQEDYFTALTRLLAFRDFGRLPHHGVDGEILQGSMSLSYGMYAIADEIFSRLMAAELDRDIQDRIRFYRGKIAYQRGEPSVAREFLASASDIEDLGLRGDRDLILATLQMDEGRYQEAADTLRKWRGSPQSARYARYNRAIALLGAGDREQAVKILRRLARSDVYTTEQDALRDRAHLTLGIVQFESGDYGAAIEWLQRIRLGGPYANQALMASGWAEWEQGRQGRALVPWIELSRRELKQMPVQEALLVVPHAYMELGAPGRAANFLGASLARYESEISSVAEAEKRVRQGALRQALMSYSDSSVIGWFWRMPHTPQIPEVAHLSQFVSAHEFHEAVKNYRDLVYLERNLSFWRDNIAAFQDMLDSRRDRYQQHRPAARDAIRKGRLTTLLLRQRELNDALSQVEAQSDPRLLATLAEQELLERLGVLSDRLQSVSDQTDTEDMTNRLRVLKGVTLWRLNAAYPDRLWQATRSMKRLEERTEEMRERYAEIRRALESTPTELDAFADRIQTARVRLMALHGKVEYALHEQGGYLDEITVTELRAGRRRLKLKLEQARLTRARAFDAVQAEGGTRHVDRAGGARK